MISWYHRCARYINSLFFFPRLMTSAAVQVLAAVYLFADPGIRESVKKELPAVMEDGSSIEAWATSKIGGQTEANQKPAGQKQGPQRKKSKKK